uniref:carboxymuconolactone decarboxylase family protein n=1 Tax=Yoonia sp. TaxID=2212373 RepID=UPI004048BC27|tara:strand:+ start:51956 stop:52354 length:399 start_codon:yes stop_codon:yes gene_type:complete
MTDKNPFEAMMAMGQDWAKQLNPGMEAFTTKGFADLFPTMSKEMMEQFFGKGMNPEGLDAKTKLLLTLNALTVTGATAEPQIRLTVRHLVAAGATKQEIAETIAQAAMFGGVPAMTKAMDLATDVMEKDAGQ